MSQAEAGKGDARRVEDTKAYEENYLKIFGESGPLARKKRHEALVELVRINEELGLYEDKK